MSDTTKRRKGKISRHTYRVLVFAKLGRELTKPERAAMAEARLQQITPTDFVQQITQVKP